MNTWTRLTGEREDSDQQENKKVCMNKALFTSKTNEWATPRDFFEELNREFSFTLDPCSTDENAKCKKHFTEQDDGLTQNWGGEIVFCNPPYGVQLKRWVHKAYLESRKANTIVVMLIPARTDTDTSTDSFITKPKKSVSSKGDCILTNQRILLHFHQWW